MISVMLIPYELMSVNDCCRALVRRGNGSLFPALVRGLLMSNVKSLCFYIKCIVIKINICFIFVYLN